MTISLFNMPHPFKCFWTRCQIQNAEFGLQIEKNNWVGQASPLHF